MANFQIEQIIILLIIEYSKTMGCQNSQVGDLAPQPPHVLNQEGPPFPHHTLGTPVETLSPSDPPQGSTPQANKIDKENLQPCQSAPSSRKEPLKASEKPVDNFSENKKKSKSEKIMEEMKLVETTNCPKDNLVMENQKQKEIRRQSKVLSARSSYKAEGQNLGPSSKTIEASQEAQVQTLPAQRKQTTTGEQGFPITKILKQRSANSLKISQGENMAENKHSDVNVAMQPFILQEWQGIASQRSNLGQKKLVQEQVSNYLDQILVYQKEALDAVIARLQERQIKKYQTSQ